MSYRRNAGGGKRDTAEAPILEVLATIPGMRYWQLSGPGNPDLLVLSHFARCPHCGHLADRYYPCEVKTGNAQRTDRQLDIPWPIVRTPTEMLVYLGLLQ